MRVLISWSLDAFDAVSTLCEVLSNYTLRLHGVLLDAQFGSDETVSAAGRARLSLHRLWRNDCESTDYDETESMPTGEA